MGPYTHALALGTDLSDSEKQAVAGKLHEYTGQMCIRDSSHVSDATFYRTLRISRAPVIASHSGARALCNAPRNMTDDMIRAVATYGGGPNSKGGVVQVNFFAGFVSQAYWDAMKAQQPEIDKAIADAKDKANAEGREFKYADEEKIQRSFMDRIPRPPLSMLIDHIDHIARICLLYTSRVLALVIMNERRKRQQRPIKVRLAKRRSRKHQARRRPAPHHGRAIVLLRSFKLAAHP